MNSGAPESLNEVAVPEEWPDSHRATEAAYNACSGDTKLPRVGPMPSRPLSLPGPRQAG
ncbi:protein of unknown function [Streptomyces sp. KY75]|nr:protein of unknown function [Streptomyces sp. KY70]CAD5987260.1 protein of unknown function [Streptomyces sp. KY75]